MNDDELKKRLYVSNFDEWQTDCQIKFFSDRELTVKTVKSGLILPPVLKKAGKYNEYSGGVCDEYFNFVDGFYRCKAPGNTSDEIRSSYRCTEEEIETINEDVIWGGLVIGHFGHIILECLGKMWYILQNPSRKEKIVFIRFIRKKSEDLFIKFLNLLDIPKERILFISKPTKFNSIIVPESSIHSECDYTKEYLMPYKYICNKIKPSIYKKIYLTRSKFGNSNKTINEEYFEEYFSKHGYKVISPEKLSLEEQISLISGANEIAATIGTLTHWALFCKPGTKFTMILRKNYDLSMPQCLVNEATKVNWYIVDASVGFLRSAHHDGPHFLGSTIYWQKYIQDHFNDSVPDDRWKSYIFEYMLQWGIVNLNPECKIKERGINFVRSLDVMSFLRSLYNLLKYNGLPYELKNYLDKDLDNFSAKYDLENIVIFGAGNWGKNLIKIFKQSKYRDMKMYFCDNDPNKWHKSIFVGGGVSNSHFSGRINKKLSQ